MLLLNIQKQKITVKLKRISDILLKD
jgi:hypothetical protein